MYHTEKANNTKCCPTIDLFDRALQMGEKPMKNVTMHVIIFCEIKKQALRLSLSEEQPTCEENESFVNTKIQSKTLSYDPEKQRVFAEAPRSELTKLALFIMRPLLWFWL